MTSGPTPNDPPIPGLPEPSPAAGKPVDGPGGGASDPTPSGPRQRYCDGCWTKLSPTAPPEVRYCRRCSPVKPKRAKAEEPKPVKIDYAPHPKQEIFGEAIRRGAKIIFFLAGVRSGKTIAGAY